MSSATVLKKAEAIAIGGFDGMHVGHQHLFDVLGENGAIVVIESGFANLTPGRARELYTHHPILYLPLDSVREMTPDNFLAYLMTQFPRLRTIVVGYDFRFGKNRKASAADLGSMFSGDVVVVDEVCAAEDSVHSHKIRQKLSLGDVEGANRFLGHHYTIRGTIVTGQGLGKRELVPTVNMTADGYLIPQEGVYASVVRLDEEEHYHPAVTFIGHRVTTDGSFAVESHILDGEITCHSSITVSLIRYLRGNLQFESLPALKVQIDSDIASARKTLMMLQL